MPNYDYLCGECEHRFEEVQSIMAPALTECPACSKNTLRRVLHAVHIFSRGEAKTVAQQADRNVANMGHYELEAKRHEHAEAGAMGRKTMGPQPERPWWRDTDKVNTDLAKLAPDVTIENGKIVKSEPLSQKAMEYINTGKL